MHPQPFWLKPFEVRHRSMTFYLAFPPWQDEVTFNSLWRLYSVELDV